MRFLLLLFFISTALSAQSNFLNNSDIVWAAEIEQDWVVDIPSFEEEWERGVITLKQLRRQDNELHCSSPYLAELVFEAVRSGDLAVFKDSDCKVKTNIEEAFPNKGMVVTFDPVTYEDHVVEVFDQPAPYPAFKAWRLRQVLAYHKKSATWKTRVLSIAPLIYVRDCGDDSGKMQPLFWFKPDNKRRKISSNKIVWVKKTVSGKQPQTEVPARPTNLVKTTKDFKNPVSHLLRVFETNKRSPFYDSQGVKLLSFEERKYMLSRTDTIVSYNWETYEETIAIEHKGITDSVIQQLRLVQTWYWDERHARLSICLDAVAPVVDALDERGYFRFARPLFYRRTKR